MTKMLGILILAATLLTACGPGRNCPYAADFGHDHSYMPGWADASERWDVSVSDATHPGVLSAPRPVLNLPAMLPSE
jgi:hypothetical protein